MNNLSPTLHSENPDNDILNEFFFIVLKREKHKQSHHTIMDTKRMEIRL